MKYGDLKNSNNQIKYTGKILARNTVYNLFGHISPLFVALIAIPYLIDGMGKERFGVLTMAWIAVGYFSLFDMGIGRATTKFVAEYYAKGYQHKLMGLVKASMFLLLGFGIVMGTILAAITPWLVGDMLNIPEGLQGESATAFYLLSVSLPIALIIAGARGVLESQQRFGVINAIRIPASVATFLIPLMILPFSNTLIPIIGALVLSRLIALGFYLSYCYRGLARLGGNAKMEKEYFKQLLSFGGWLTVCNIIGPLLGSMDRFFIGSLITLSAVVYYATPFDVVTKLFIIPVGIMGVVFPAFSAFSAGEEERLDNLHRRTLNYIIATVAPVAACIITFASPLIDMWLGREFAAQSSLVLQLLAAGVLFSSVTRVAYNAIQAMGRADLPAKLFMIELPIYIGILIFVTERFGIVGTAGLWFTRLFIELAIFAVLYKRVSGRKIFKVNYIVIYFWLIGTLAAAFALSLIPDLYARIASFVVFLAVFGTLVYVNLFDNYDRLIIKDGISRIKRGRLS
ncbi:MAG: flippase [candidate division Zixibacteria bacterium]